jgi:hypothetical protein
MKCERCGGARLIRFSETSAVNLGNVSYVSFQPQHGRVYAYFVGGDCIWFEPGPDRMAELRREIFGQDNASQPGVAE